MPTQQPANAENVAAFYKYQQDHVSDQTEQCWVLVVDGDVKGAFASYEDAFNDGLKKFSDCSFMIRDAHEEDLVVPFVFSEA